MQSFILERFARLRRVHAHLTHGTRPTVKTNKKTTIGKRYVRNVSRDGLLIVKQSQPFLPENENENENDIPPELHYQTSAFYVSLY